MYSLTHSFISLSLTPSITPLLTPSLTPSSLNLSLTSPSLTPQDTTVPYWYHWDKGILVHVLEPHSGHVLYRRFFRLGYQTHRFAEDAEKLTAMLNCE